MASKSQQRMQASEDIEALVLPFCVISGFSTFCFALHQKCS